MSRVRLNEAERYLGHPHFNLISYRIQQRSNSNHLPLISYDIIYITFHLNKVLYNLINIWSFCEFLSFKQSCSSSEPRYLDIESLNTHAIPTLLFLPFLSVHPTTIQNLAQATFLILASF
jgi:hypothetical protein